MQKLSDEYIYEIAFCRPILIILLVLYHSFAIYNGVWDLPSGAEHVAVYTWVAEIAYSFMLPMFFFMSGYVWGWQRMSGKDSGSFVLFVKKKFERLYLPCLFFGLLYIALFEEKRGLLRIVYTLISGVGHLWFLPVLFLCFVICRLLSATGKSHLLIFVLFLVLSLLSELSFWPQRLADVFFYIPFFWGGFLIQNVRDNIGKRSSAFRLIVLWLAFSLVFFLMRTCVMPVISGLEDIPFVLRSGMDVLCKSFYAWVGLVALYETALFVCMRVPIPLWYLKCGTYSMGVYVFHQFVIKYIYYRTDVGEVFNSYMLPWMVFFLSMLLSYILVYLFKYIRL